MSQVADRSGATPEYWRSLEELADTPEFRQYVAAEFPTRAQELIDPLSRRRFMQVMGASLALAGVSGCDFLRMPKETILPFASRPQHRHPGTSVAYATSYELGGVGTGLLVTSYDGRPIKVEGNPQHPESLGATNAYMQASLLDMYDPDRSQSVLKVDAGVSAVATWEEAEAALEPRFKELKAAKGKGLAVITAASSSASFARLMEKLRRDLPEAKVCVWEPVSHDAAREGARLAFGRPLRAQLDLSKADVVVSLDADFLDQHPGSLRLARQFARRRRPEDGKLNRLYMAEGGFSITGGMADHRVGLRAAEVGALVTKLAAELVAQGLEAPASVKAWVKDRAAPEGDVQRTFVQRLARDLLASRGASVLIAGARQPASVHAAAALLNQLLGNVGATVVYTDDPGGDLPAGAEALAAVVEAMNAGQVQTALLLGTNPLYDAPVDLGFPLAYAKVGERVHCGTHWDETGRASTWHLPMAHYLEAWGDARAWDGTLSAVQPLIAPLFAGRSAAEVLALVTGETKRGRKGYELARRTFMELTGLEGVEFERAWRLFLHDGVLQGSALPAVEAPLLADAVVAAQPDQGPAALAAGEYELVFTPDPRVWDGRYANNAWLQEFPAPLTKLTWDNALLVNPVTARDLRIKGDDLVSVSVKAGDETYGPLEVAVYVLPGQPRKTVSLSLGCGRGEAAGVVAKGTGFNAYPLRARAGLDAAVCTIQPTGESYYLATTQDHHSIRTPLGDTETQDRVFGERIEFEETAGGVTAAVGTAASSYVAPLVREGTVEQYEANPRFAKVIVGPDPVKTQLWDPPYKYGEGYQWGMTIDLSACTGCGSCVVACVAENNVPMVGKSEVARGREMHWLRIDRYFKGDPLEWVEAGEAAPAAPKGVQMANQPMLCMQCENAPCEAVCPVGATVHSEEGLNDMAYNRCVGTRYCANNCPYKVRRFNYFWNHHGPFHPRSNPVEINGEVARKLPKPAITAPELPVLERMKFNPEVTVRSRGVMEKCTYCVQRIQKVTIKARNEQRAVRDGEIQTACQQVCATEAIVFGNLNDPESAVSKLQARDRTYALLAELATRPRTQYLARLRNPGQEA